MPPPEEQPNQDPGNHDSTLIALGHFVILFAIALLFAVLAPSERFASVLSSLLFFTAAVAAFNAMRLGERLDPDQLTNWDVSAALMALSLLARIFAKA